MWPSMPDIRVMNDGAPVIYHMGNETKSAPGWSNVIEMNENGKQTWLEL